MKAARFLSRSAPLLFSLTLSIAASVENAQEGQKNVKGVKIKAQSTGDVLVRRIAFNNIRGVIQNES